MVQMAGFRPTLGSQLFLPGDGGGDGTVQWFSPQSEKFIYRKPEGPLTVTPTSVDFDCEGGHCHMRPLLDSDRGWLVAPDWSFDGDPAAFRTWAEWLGENGPEPEPAVIPRLVGE